MQKTIYFGIKLIKKLKFLIFKQLRFKKSDRNFFAKKQKMITKRLGITEKPEVLISDGTTAPFKNIEIVKNSFNT